MPDAYAEFRLERIEYKNLNPRQQENYNFHKLAARLADYGYTCLHLSNDWQGADLIASHIDGDKFHKIQLKGRLVYNRKYENKEIFVAFFHGTRCFVYPHDDFKEFALQSGSVDEQSRNWKVNGFREWPKPPKWSIEYLENYEVH